MRALIGGLVALLFAIPALAEDTPSEPARELEQVQQRIDALEAKKRQLVEERDAARVRANIYVLPQDKTAVIEKTEEIEETDEALRKLRQKQRELQQVPRGETVTPH